MPSTPISEGSLAEEPLSDVLLQLAENRATGALRIRNGGAVWLAEGRIYLAQSAQGPRVADVLFGADVGTLADINSALNGAGSQSALDTLLSGNQERAQVLERLIHEANLSAMFELLVPSKEQFTFDEGATHRLGTAFSEPAAALVDQAQRRLEIWKKIAKRIPNTSVKFGLNPTLPGDEQVITNDEWRYLALLDGRTTVAAVIAETGDSAFRVCSGLYRLLLEDLIHEITE